MAEFLLIYLNAFMCFQFAETSFLDGLYWESWYETKNVSDGNLGFVLHENKLLGVPRIRMLRVCQRLINVYYMGSL